MPWPGVHLVLSIALVRRADLTSRAVPFLARTALQVFIIAAREFLDFAVFLFYILVLLGSAVFAFFQLTGGNFQFLRFPDGLSLMSRLTFGGLHTSTPGLALAGPVAHALGTNIRRLYWPSQRVAQHQGHSGRAYCLTTK